MDLDVRQWPLNFINHSHNSQVPMLKDLLWERKNTACIISPLPPLSQAPTQQNNRRKLPHKLNNVRR